MTSRKKLFTGSPLSSGAGVGLTGAPDRVFCPTRYTAAFTIVTGILGEDAYISGKTGNPA